MPWIQSYQRPRRQLRGRGRHTAFGIKGRAPQTHKGFQMSKQTHSAMKIQRAFRKKRYVARKPISYRTEIFQLRLAAQSANLVAISGSTINGSENSLLLLPAGS